MRRNPSSPDAESVYQRFRQRTPILIFAAMTIAGLVIHSLPRRRALFWNADPQPIQQQQRVEAEAGGGDDLAGSPAARLGAGGGATAVGQLRAPPPSAVDSAVRVAVSKGSVHLGLGDELEDLPYLHCGPTYGTSSKLDGAGRELILLHGKVFTKDTWRESGILDGLCLLGSSEEGRDGDEGGLSVTALDLPVTASGVELGAAFKALWSAGMISGEAAFFVSPSASGETIVNLAELAKGFETHEGGKELDEDPSKLLRRLVRGWIPVAAPYVIKARDEAIAQFAEAEIPILAVYGDKDKMGETSSNRLVESANAQTLELEGGHPCYLDSPDEFVKNVIQFVNGEWDQSDDSDEGDSEQ